MNESSSVITKPATPGNRLYYLDWLRVIAIIGIFFFHNTRFFDFFSDWHVKNAVTNAGASYVMAFMGQWIMPLFFVIAGAGTYYAFKIRHPGQFAKERMLRLLVPLIFGMLIIVVPQAYYQAVFRGEMPPGNLILLYPLYLQTLPDLNWFHLWYLAYLFLFSLITIPLFFSRKGVDRSIISRLAALIKKPWVLMLIMVISIGLLNSFIYPDGFWGHRGSGGWNIIANFLFYVFGYLIYANTRYMEWVKKYVWYILGIAVVSTASILLVIEALADLTGYYGTPLFIGAHFVQAVVVWSWVLSILGLAGRYLERTNRFLNYANEAVLPFYILHQTIIITVGFYVIQWSAGVGIKYLVISSISFALIMLIYELLIRRINVLRFLFGMRAKKKTVPVKT